MTGSARSAAGTTDFTIENAVVYYELPRFEPGRIRIASATLEHQPALSAVPDGAGFRIEALPSPVTVDQLHLIYDDSYEFSGSIAFTGSEQSFSVDAINEQSHLTISGDSSLSAFDLTLVDLDQQRIGEARIELGGSEISSFAMDAHLEPALAWLRDMDLMPGVLTAQTDEIESISGQLQVEGRPDQNGLWALTLKLDLQRLATEKYNSSGKIAGDLRAGDNRWTFTLARDGEARLTTVDQLLTDVYSFNVRLPTGYSLSHSTTGTGNMTLSGSGESSVAFYRSGGLDLKAQVNQWSLDDWQRVRVEMHSVEITDPVEVSIDSLKTGADLGDPPGGNATLSGVKTSQWPADVGAAAIQLEWKWDDAALLSNGTARLDGPPDVSWKLFNRGNSGSIEIELDTAAPDLLKPFRSYLRNNQQDLELFEGSVSGRLNWAWDNERYDNKLGLSATGVQGRFIGLDFENARMEITSSDLVTPTFKFNGAFPSINLANDVNVTDIAIAGRWQSGFYLDQARMSLLGGHLKINPVFLDPDDPELSAELEIDEIDLEKVMLMIDQDGLDASGRMSGMIPLRMKESDIAIDDGRMKNTTVGRLSYVAGDAASTQMDNIALQALKDFHYDLLDATLNYQFDGDYAIRARIEGRNPSLYDGFPVAFNLNLTGSLPGLLRASLITGDFHTEILRQIQQQ